MGFFSDIVKGFVNSNPIGQFANLGVSAINSYFDRQAQRESNKLNAEQNELNREFNAQEAEKNRQFQSAETEKQNAFNAAQSQLAFDRSAKFQQEMWNKENEYNTPLAQIKRLEAAGINPNMFGGDNTAGSAGSAVSPAASGSAPSGSAASVGSSIPNQPVSYVNPLLEASQIRLAESQAKLNEANTDESKERAEDIRQLRQGKLDLQNVEIHCGLATERFTEQQLRNAFKESLKLDKEMQISEQSLRNMQQELANMKLQGNMTAKELDAFDKRLQSQISLALAQSAAQYGMANVSKKQCELLAEQITHQSIENGLIAIDFGKAFAGAPSSTGLLISSNESEQSYYDWANGDWFNKIWGSDASVPRKLWKTATSYGNWLTHSIGVGMNGSFIMRENKAMLQSVK